MELLKEIVPKLSRVGILWNIDARDIGFGRGFKEYQAAAQSLHIPLESLPIRASNVDFVAAFNVGAQARNRFVFRYIEPRFHVRGMLGTARMAEYETDIWNYFERGMAMGHHAFAYCPEYAGPGCNLFPSETEGTAHYIPVQLDPSSIPSYSFHGTHGYHYRWRWFAGMLDTSPADLSHSGFGPAFISQVDVTILSVRRYLNFLRWLILQPVNRLVFRHKVSNRSGAILVVHPCRIGDMVLWLDAARGLRELYPPPAHRIVLLADTFSASLVRSQPYFDMVWDLDRARFCKSPRYRWQILRKIAGERFSVALNPAAWQDYYVADSIMGACGASEKVGWSLRPDSHSPAERLMRAWRARKYSRLLSMPAERQGMLQLNSEFLHALGHNNFVGRAPKLNLDRQVGMVADSSPYYVLCPGAADPIRRWPSERFAALAEGIFAATGMRGSICGSNAEKQLAIAICALTDAPLSDLTGSMSLEQFAQFAAGASLVISNESGPLHIAAAAGAPTLCILGGGQFGWCVPYDSPPQEGMRLPQAVWYRMECFGCNWRCVFKISPGDAAPCVVNVSAGDATAAALAILASTGVHKQEHRNQPAL